MKTYADTYQDAFALQLLGNNKFFLDIGCSNGVEKSNSLLLEENGWEGVLIDAHQPQIEDCRRNRKSKNIYCIDATNPELLLKAITESQCPSIIDYISLDVDSASLTCLQNFPLNSYRFKFMTFEHDLYAGRQECIDRKTITPVFLAEKGYTKLIDNVAAPCGAPYEDWYISNEYTDVINLFKGASDMRAEAALEILIKSDLHI